MTLEQAAMLAAIEQKHGRMRRIPEDCKLGEELLCQCVTDTRAYECLDCHSLFTIEPDGEAGIWSFVRDRS